jgi:hypothetical protein
MYFIGFVTAFLRKQNPLTTKAMRGKKIAMKKKNYHHYLVVILKYNKIS